MLDSVPSMTVAPGVGSKEPGVDLSILLGPRDMAAAAEYSAAATGIARSVLLEALTSTLDENRLMIADLIEIEEGAEARVEFAFIELEEASGTGCIAITVVPERLATLLSDLFNGEALSGGDIAFALGDYLGSGVFSAA